MTSETKQGNRGKQNTARVVKFLVSSFSENTLNIRGKLVIGVIIAKISTLWLECLLLSVYCSFVYFCVYLSDIVCMQWHSHTHRERKIENQILFRFCCFVLFAFILYENDMDANEYSDSFNPTLSFIFAMIFGIICSETFGSAFWLHQLIHTIQIRKQIARFRFGSWFCFCFV